jgi:hypothetical protein
MQIYNILQVPQWWTTPESGNWRDQKLLGLLMEGANHYDNRLADIHSFAILWIAYANPLNFEIGKKIKI